MAYENGKITCPLCDSPNQTSVTVTGTTVESRCRDCGTTYTTDIS